MKKKRAAPAPRRRKAAKRRWPRILLWVLVGAPAIVLGLAALLNWVIMPLVTRFGKELPIPEVKGMLQAEAESTLVGSGLAVGDVRVVSDTAFSPGRVVGQYPHAGRRVKPGRRVDLDVSRGANRLLVPAVAEMSVKRAVELLEESGFLVAEIESLRTPNVPAGRVIAVRPPAGTEVERGASLVLAIAAPVGKFPMPNLLGSDIETANGIIASQGLVLGVVRDAPSDEPVGLVLVQFPEEGMSVGDGDSVHLIVAAPPLPDSTP